MLVSLTDANGAGVDIANGIYDFTTPKDIPAAL